MKQILTRFVRYVLPWIAVIVTKMPYSKSASRFLDKLTVIAEGDSHLLKRK